MEFTTFVFIVAILYVILIFIYIVLYITCYRKEDEIPVSIKQNTINDISETNTVNVNNIKQSTVNNTAETKIVNKRFSAEFFEIIEPSPCTIY